MKHAIGTEKELGEGYLCQMCDEAFFHLGTEEPTCPKCNAKGTDWLTPLPLKEEDEQRIGAGTADTAGAGYEDAGTI